jgi:hypothetical protein
MSADRASSFFWLFVAVVVSVAAFRLGLGSVSTPGAGFLAFSAAVLLGLLSIVSFVQAEERRGGPEVEPFFRGTHWPKVVLVFVALLAYTQLMPWAGYNTATFLLMVFLFRIMERQKIWKVGAYALATTVITYYVFSKGLNLQFPVGPLGF